jgi:hypothetical protein
MHVGLDIDLPDSDVGGLSDLASFLDNTQLLNGFTLRCTINWLLLKLQGEKRRDR